MHNIAEWQRVLSFAAIGLNLLLLAKLWSAGLIRRYRWFSMYLLAGVFSGALLLFAHPRSNQYAVLWGLTRPLEWAMGLAVVLEVYSLVLHRYPGIASLTRWAILAGVIVSLVLSIGSLGWDFQNPHEKFPMLRTAFAIQRTIDNTMVWALLMPWLLMARFPIRLCRNVILHVALFSMFVGTEAVGLFVRTLLGHQWNVYTNLAVTMGTNLCLVAWITMLSRKGEVAEKVVLARQDPEREKELIDQLKSFNQMLLRPFPQGAR